MSSLHSDATRRAVDSVSDRFKVWWVGPILMLASVIGFGIMAWGLHQNQTFDAEHATTVQGTTVGTVSTWSGEGAPAFRREVNRRSIWLRTHPESDMIVE